MGDDPQNDTVLETIAFAAVDDLLVLCHSHAHPSDSEWDTWLETERQRKHRALLVVTQGGAPNARQRARVAEVLGEMAGPNPPVALVTDSGLNRLLMSAFTWLLGHHHRMKAFAPNAVSEAVEWTGAKAPPERVNAVIERLQTSLARRWGGGA